MAIQSILRGHRFAQTLHFCLHRLGGGNCALLYVVLKGIFIASFLFNSRREHFHSFLFPTITLRAHISAKMCPEGTFFPLPGTSCCLFVPKRLPPGTKWVSFVPLLSYISPLMRIIATTIGARYFIEK